MREFWGEVRADVLRTLRELFSPPAEDEAGDPR